MKGKMYLGSKKIENGLVLDQQVRIKYTDYNDIVEYTRKYGGSTILNNTIVCNYKEYETLDIYDKNKVKLLVPAGLNIDRLFHIKRTLDILGVKHYSTYTNGYWLNNDNHIVLDELELITFTTHYTEDRLNFIISIMDNLKWELNQESTAMFWNSQLILI